MAAACAVAVLAEKRSGAASRFQRGAPAALRELGESPVTGKPVKIMPGRYGNYVSDGESNATMPKDATPESMTFELALMLLAKRREAAPPKKAKKAAPKKEAKAEAKPKKAAAKSKKPAEGKPKKTADAKPKKAKA